MSEGNFELQKKFEEQIKKMVEEASKKGISSSPTYYTTTTATTNDSKTWSYVDGTWTAKIGDFGVVWGKTDSRLDFIPTKIIFNPPATVCFFLDGSKVVVKCADDEEFVEEEGVMACIVKKIFASRNAFKKAVKEAYRQPKEEKKSKEGQDNIATITVDETFTKQETEVIEKQIKKEMETS